ncbi:Alpha/Beta hydrolase protein [Xylariaceae sp. FL0255]|nr:Alpha/Beta hydrolase protein [Xylariaceae sp. FL0255]
MPRHRLLLPPAKPKAQEAETLQNDKSDDISDDYGQDHDLKPLIMCFHGSGETCSPAWDDLATALVAETDCRVLLYDRGDGNQSADTVGEEMWEFLLPSSSSSSGTLRGPYLLIAHSYGGAFARVFLQREHEFGHRGRNTNANTQGYQHNSHNNSDNMRSDSDMIVGVVLVETGQEGGLDPALDERQIRTVVLGSRPLCVVRGNSLLGKWRALEEAEAQESGPSLSLNLVAQRRLLERVDAEDERLKRRQLGLSRNSRFVHVPDCGHHVVRDRPDVVIEAVKWVLENPGEVGEADELEETERRDAVGRKSLGSWWQRFRRFRPRVGAWKNG